MPLHSYRYSWAQRAKDAGYPQRYARQALGHSSETVAEAYATDAQRVLPCLEAFELRNGVSKVIVLDFPKDLPANPAVEGKHGTASGQPRLGTLLEHGICDRSD